MNRSCTIIINLLLLRKLKLQCPRPLHRQFLPAAVCAGLLAFATHGPSAIAAPFSKVKASASDFKDQFTFDVIPSP